MARQRRKCTPGPWIALEGGFVYAPDKTQNRMKCDGEMQHPNRFSLRIQNDNGNASKEEIEANAELISAAPELYRALTKLLNVVKFSGYTIPVKYSEQAHAALKKKQRGRSNGSNKSKEGQWSSLRWQAD